MSFNFNIKINKQCENCLYYQKEQETCEYYKHKIIDLHYKNIIKTEQNCLYYISKSKNATKKYPYSVYIKGYENLYAIDKDANIYSFHNQNIKKIKPIWNYKTQSYYVFLIDKFHNKETYRLQRLIANTFIKNPTNLKYILFQDKNKKNCCANNLYWSNQYCDTNPEYFKRKGVYKLKHHTIISKTDTTSCIGYDH